MSSPASEPSPQDRAFSERRLGLLILENKAGAPAFKAVRRRERQHPIEEVGRRLRKLMAWINAKEV